MSESCETRSIFVFNVGKKIREKKNAKNGCVSFFL